MAAAAAATAAVAATIAVAAAAAAAAVGDPYARFCDFNSNECFVVLPPAATAAAAAAAAGEPARSPKIKPWNKWIIYELHPSTFVTPEKGKT